MAHINVNGFDLDVKSNSTKTSIKKMSSTDVNKDHYGSSYGSYSTISFSTNIMSTNKSYFIKSLLMGRFHSVRFIDWVSSTGVRINPMTDLISSPSINDSDGTAGCVKVNPSNLRNGIFSMDFNLSSQWTVLFDFSLDGSLWSKTAILSNGTVYTDGVLSSLSGISFFKGSLSCGVFINTSAVPYYLSNCVVFHDTVIDSESALLATSPAFSIANLISKSPNVKISINSSPYIGAASSSIDEKFTSVNIDGIFDSGARSFSVKMEES